MRRIFTFSFLTAALLAASFNSFAQTCTPLSTTAPVGPTFGSNLAINTTNGFSSTGQATPFTYPNGGSSSITSPIYFYDCSGGSQATLYFRITLQAANGANATALPTVTILYGNPLQSFNCTAATSTTIANTATAYYFSITPATPFNCNFNFQVRLAIATGSRDLTATQFAITTNASLASGSLPVKFSNFEGKAVRNGTNLVWNVAAEENVARYEVEKSLDNRNFSNIGNVEASGKDSYSLVDTKASTAKSYYRVKAVDIDGKLTYSPIVTMKGGRSSVTLRGFPMPAGNELTLQHSTATSESAISISSAEGREVKTVIPAKGTQQTVISISSLKPGMYVVRYTTGNGDVETLKIVKQ